MTVAVKCAACGAINTIGRLFCVRCGQPLNTRDIRPASRGGARRVVRLVRLLILLGLIAALVQMARPVASGGQVGTTEDGINCERRMNSLRVAIASGRAVEERFTEREINGYLQHLLTNSPNRVTSGLVRAELESIRVQLLADETVLVWSARLGVLPLTYEVAGRPAAGDQGFRFEVRRVRAGRLPLPGRVGAWAAARLFQVFSNLEREKKMLDDLAELQAEAGLAVARSGAGR